MHIKIRSTGRLRTHSALFAISILALAICLGRSTSLQHGTTTPHSSLFSVAMRPADMSKAQDSQLRRLSQYEHVLQHQFTSEMLFVATPRTTTEAQTEAATLAVTLKEYQEYNLAPLVIVEPTAGDGTMIDLNAVHTVPYVTALQSLCDGLQRAGITDAQMGTIVPLPEADLPDWAGASTDPGLFAQNYKAVGSIFKRSFPGARLSLLLDSTTYPNGDTEHLDGDMSLGALQHYIAAIKQTPGMPTIDSLGFQGFPWTTSDNASDYLSASKAQALARELGVRTIWLNTGTARSYGGTTVPDSVRKRLLQEELAQARTLQMYGFGVRIAIFGFTDPDVDWTYSLSVSDQSTVSLSQFMQDASISGVETSLFAPVD